MACLGMSENTPSAEAEGGSGRGAVAAGRGLRCPVGIGR